MQSSNRGRPADTEPAHTYSDEIATDGQSNFLQLIRRPASERLPDNCSQNPHVVIGRLASATSSTDAWLIELDDALRLPARKAVSCLIAPAQGDLVQATVHGSTCWITAVLERGTQAGAELLIDTANQTLTIRAQAFRVRAEEEIAYIGDSVKVKSLTLREEVEHRTSVVHGTSSTCARSVNIEALSHLALHAPMTTLTADSLVKVDAPQVHIS
ncbi:DUF3540 domain-containing protein [Paraburkholderia susongensis]|nr:DUF3540 domain-containing protein [Paraburkholderia susongensis]